MPLDREDELDQLARAIALSLRVSEPEPDADQPEAESSPREPAAASDGAASSTAGAAPEAPPAKQDVGTEAPASTGEDGPWRPERVGSSDEVKQLSRTLPVEARHYAVWGLAGANSRAWAGVHSGHHPDPYDGVIRLNGGNWGGLRWRRCPTCEEAVVAWLREAHKHPGVPVHPPLYWWGPRPWPFERK